MNKSTVPSQAAAKSSAEIFIAAPVDRVWRLLVEIDQWPHWNRAVSSARLQAPLAVGADFTWKSQGFTVVSTLTEVQSPQRLAWRGRAFGTRALHVWEIEPTGKGVLVRTFESFDGWLPCLMPRAMQRQLDETLPAWLSTLKQAAEAGPGR